MNTNGVSNGKEARYPPKRRARCECCGRAFHMKRPWQKFHSNACGNRARQRRRAVRVKVALEAMDGAD